MKNSANTTGTSSCRDEVAGSASETYDPPCPAAKQKRPTEAASTPIPPVAERKTATPDSHATTQASGTRTDASRWMTTEGSRPEIFTISARNPCQSGKAYPG